MRVSKGAFNTLVLRQRGMGGGFQQRVREITQMINSRSTAGANLISHNYPCKCDRPGGEGGAGMLNLRSLIGLFVLAVSGLGDCGSCAMESLSAGEKPGHAPKHLTQKAKQSQL